MRVVFLTHDYLRKPGDVSGAPLEPLIRALMRRRISVRVVTPSDEAGDSEIEGVQVVRVSVPHSLRDLVSSNERVSSALRNPIGWLSLRRLRSALRSAVQREIASGADVLHAHSWLPAGLAAPTNVPCVMTVYGSDASLLRRSRLARSLARPVLQRAQVVTAVSREVGNWVQAAAGRLVDTPHIHPMPVDTRSYPWTRGGGGAVVISRLVPSKRVDLALGAVAVLASSGHDIPLTIVGDGPERAALEQQSNRLGIKRLVRFVGTGSLSDARVYLERADVMLFTARGQGVAPAAIEALACGVPVVASWDSGAAVDIVPESGPGRLTLPSAEAMADSVLEIQGDPDRLAMGRLVGESWRARLAPDNVAELCERWYRSALAG
ncbi:MAG TPA: glycosyltransferase [Gemmatimonadales bacterium]|nr:glycosyltransferase [Gemmatimonadales bacterium]